MIMKHSSRLSVRYEHDESGLSRGDGLAGAIADGLRQAALPGVSPLSENALIAALRAQHAMLAEGAASVHDDEETSERPQRRRRDRAGLPEDRAPRAGGRKLEVDAVLAATLLLGSATATEDGRLGKPSLAEGQPGPPGRDGIDPFQTGSGRRPALREGGPGGSAPEATSGHAGEGLIAAAFLPLGARSITPETPLSFASYDPAFLLAGPGIGSGGPPARSGMQTDGHGQLSPGGNLLPVEGGSGTATPAFLPADGWPRPAIPAGIGEDAPPEDPSAPADPAPPPTIADPVIPPVAPVPPAPPAPAFRFGQGVTLSESGGHAAATPFGAAIDEQGAHLVTVSNGDLVSARLRLASDGVFSGLFTTDGEAIHLFSDGDHRVVGRTLQGRTVLVVTSDDRGDVQASLLAPVRHGAPNSATDDLVSLDGGVLHLDISMRGIDGSQEQGTIDIGAHIGIEDSSFQPPQTPGVVPAPEDGMAVRFDTQRVPAGFLFVENANGTLGIYQHQQGVDVLVRELAWSGDHLTVTDIAPVITPLAQGLEDLSLPVHYSLVDGDGDRLDLVTTLVVTDRLPETVAVEHVLTNRATVETVRGHALTSPDGVTSLQWRTDGAPQGTDYVLDPADSSGMTLLVQQGGITRIVARLDPATGDYAVTRVAPLEHGTLHSLILDLAYDVTDRDGDTAEGHVSLQVDDTVPDLDNPTLSIVERFGTQTVSAHAFSTPDGFRSAVWDLPATVPAGFQYLRDPADPSGATLIVRQQQNGAFVTILSLVLDRQTGECRATQIAPLLEDGSNGGQSVLSFGFGVRDTDDDLATGTVTLRVDRIGVAVRTVTLTSTETGTPQHLEQAAYTPTANLARAEWLTSGAPQGFVYQTDPADASGRTLFIRQGNLLVATLVIDEATGRIIADHDTAFIHAAGNGANDQIFQLGYRLTDRQGSTQDNRLRFVITDSTPETEVVNTAFVESDSRRVLTGNAFSATDGVAGVSWLTTGAPTGVTYRLDAADPTGRTLLVQQGGVTRMVAQLDPATGTYTVTALQSFDHAGQPLSLDLAYTVSDRDGDRTTGHLVFAVGDSASVVTVTDVTVAESTTGSRVVVGRMSATDGIATCTWSTAGAPAGFTYRLNGSQLLVLQMQNGTEMLVMTFNCNIATGQLTAVTFAPIDHIADGTSQRFSASITVTDRDGSTTRAQVSATVTDSQPSALVLNNFPATITDGRTYNGTWSGSTSSDRSVLEIQIGTQTRRLDLSDQANVLTFTDGGLTYTFRADGTYMMVANPTRDFALQMTLRIRDSDGDVATRAVNSQVEFINVAPVATSAGFVVLTRADRVMSLADFGFSDADGNGLRHVTVTMPPNNGALLLLNGTPVTTGAVISAADIANGRLVLKFPASMTVGSQYLGFFTLTDDGGTAHGGSDTSGVFVLTFTVPYTWTDSGGSGNDTYSGGIPEDTYHGYGGNDTITGGESDDTLYGGTGDDVIYGNAGNDRLFGEDGDDELRGGDSNDVIDGGDDSDTLYGNGGDDTITGGSGIDVIYGGSGDDDLNGGSANDTIYGGTGDDLIEGGTGNDRLFGESGNNDIYGQDGDDILTGGTGRNILSGGADNDTLFGGTGLTLFLGGSGADRFVIDAAKVGNGFDQIQDYSSSDGDIIDLSELFTADVGTRFLERDDYVQGYVQGNGIYILRVSPNHNGTYYTIATVAGDTADETIRVAFKDANGVIWYDWI